MKRFLLWSLGIVVALLLLAALGGRWWFQSVFLPSDGCRLWLSEAVSRVLQVKGEFQPLQTTADSLYSEGFQAQETPFLRKLRAEQLRAEVRFSLLSRTCTVDRLEISRLLLVLNENDAGSAEPAPFSAQPLTKPQRGDLPNFQVAVRQIDLNNLDIAAPGFTWRGSRLTAKPDDAAPVSATGRQEWAITGQGGSVQSGEQPAWRVESLDARLRGASLVLTRAQLRSGEHGGAQLEGEFTPGEPANLRVAFSGVPAADWLPATDWRARLTGNLAGRLAATAEQGAVQTLNGTLALQEGELVALPALDKVAEITHIDQFRRLRLHKAQAEISGTHTVSTSSEPAPEMANWAFTVRNFLLESDGLLKVEGGFSVARGQISGTLQVGVAPSVLTELPGARDQVFTTQRDGYLWTPVQLSGPADHPQEDLTARLTRAAAAAVVEGVVNGASGVVNEVQQKAREGTKTLIDTTAPLLEKLPALPGLPGL